MLYLSSGLPLTVGIHGTLRIMRDPARCRHMRRQNAPARFTRAASTHPVRPRNAACCRQARVR